jgi:hypothetical protein
MVNGNSILKIGEVKSVEDNYGGLRIKVRLTPEDNSITNDKDLPYAFPLLPKHIHLNPKKGESVIIILSRQEEIKGQRWFLGPIISQQYKLQKDHYKQSLAMLDGNQQAIPLPNPENTASNDGSYPERDWIAIQGRCNSDVQLPPNEVRIRCGFKKNPSANNVFSLEYNDKDFAFIQMKYQQRLDEKNREYNSVINIVADRINLLSHDSREVFNMCDKNDLITDDEQSKIDYNAHPLIYGDLLIDYLKSVMEVIKTHTHAFPTCPPALPSTDLGTLNTDLDSMLSRSVKIN